MVEIEFIEDDSNIRPAPPPNWTQEEEHRVYPCCIHCRKADVYHSILGWSGHKYWCFKCQKENK